MGDVCVCVFLCVCGQLIVSGNQVLPKTMTCAVFTAFIAAIVYDLSVPDNIQDSYFGLTDFLAIIVLLIGMETFSRDPEPEPELVTHYMPVLPAEMSGESPNV